MSIMTGLVTGMIAVAATAFLDDRRSERELARAERTEWRLVLLTTDDLQGADISGVNLSTLVIDGKDMRRSNLSNADVSGAVIRNSRLDGADLRRSRLLRTEVRESSLQDADLSGANLQGGTLNRVDLSSATMPASAGAADVKEVCYSATTQWQGDPPKLDWQSCWPLTDDRDAADATDRVRPAAADCGYGDSGDFLYLYFDSVSPSTEEACAFLGYAWARGYREGDDATAFRGNRLCEGYDPASRDSVNDAIAFAGIGLLEGDVARDVALGAVTWLCPEYRKDFVAEVWTGNGS